MQDNAIMSIGADDRAAVLAFNNRHATELTWLEPDGLDRLLGQAFYARRMGNVDAFLIGFDQTADYGSANFLWFRDRYPRFAYVDRIAVDAAARGRGLARRLYEDFFDHARRAGHGIATCEVNTMPPNPASHAFHAALGFGAVGEADIYGGERSVRYYVRSI